MIVLVGATLPSAVAQPARSMFEEANTLYRNGDYGEALERYLDIVNGGRVSGTLFYNIGNCYFKLGDLGRATLFYERALKLSPRNDDVVANLELAQSLAADEIEPLPGFWLFRAVDGLLHLIPRVWLVRGLALAYVTTMLALMGQILSRSDGARLWTRRVVTVGGTAAVLLGVNLAIVEFGVGDAVEAVILVDEVAVQAAPSDDGTLELFSIHEGAKVRVEQRTGEWAEIVLADGKVGWVRQDAFEII